MEASNHIGDKWNIVWGNCIFIGNSVGCWFVSAVAVYFHFQLRGNKSSLPLWTPFKRGKVVIVFPHYRGRHRLWFHANQFDCVRSLLVFCFSQNPLQSRCNFADQYVNFADTRWCINVGFFFFFFLENWTSLPLTTYSQTDTKAFSCMIL